MSNENITLNIKKNPVKSGKTITLQNLNSGKFHAPGCFDIQHMLL